MKKENANMGVKNAEALRLQDACINTARNCRADIANSIDRIEALQRIDIYLQLLEEERQHIASAPEKNRNLRNVLIQNQCFPVIITAT